MIHSKYHFKEINGRLSLDENLKDRANLASFKCYNKFIGFFLKLFGKAQNFEAKDVNNKRKTWVVNKNSFERWSKSLPEGKDIDAKIESLVLSVKDEQSRLKSNKAKQESLSIPEPTSCEIQKTQIKDTAEINVNSYSQIDLKDPSGCPSLDEENEDEDSLENQEPEEGHLLSQEKSDESFSQRSEEQTSEAKIDELTKTQGEEQEGPQSLPDIALQFVNGQKLDNHCYIFFIQQTIVSVNSNGNPFKLLESFKRSDNRYEAIKAYQFFAKPEMLDKLETNGLISAEVKEKFLRLKMLDEQLALFAEKYQKNDLEVDKCQDLVVEKLLESEQPYFLNLEELKEKGEDGELAFKFLTNPEELEKLMHSSIITNAAKEKLINKLSVKKTSPSVTDDSNLELKTSESAETVETKDDKISSLKNRALTFGWQKSDSLKETDYIYIITNRVLSHSNFQSDPLKVLEKLNYFSDEGMIVYEFFTTSSEIEKLEQDGLISAEGREKLLKRALLKERALAFASPENIALILGSDNLNSLKELKYLYTIAYSILGDTGFQSDPLKVIESLKCLGRENRVAYEFFTTPYELENLEQNGIISTEVKEKLLKRAILKENALAFARPRKSEIFNQDLYLAKLIINILNNNRFETDPQDVVKLLKDQGETGRMAFDFFTNSDELEKLFRSGIISEQIRQQLSQREF